MAKICDKKPVYYIDDQGRFIIENYNFSKPFSSFFPGIAGKYGIPMWTFYVNRGQCISSFGVKNKDHAILEFYPANKAWQLVLSHGFRTFIRIKAPKEDIFYEPFQNGFANIGYHIKNRMLISPSGLSIEEDNLSLKIKTSVTYFNIPNAPLAGLSRILTVKNLSGQKRDLKVLDGIAQIIPYGTNNFFLKEMSRTIEAWMSVENLERKIPYFKLSTDPADRPEVVHIKEGNFYAGFTREEKEVKIIKPIIDPAHIFGTATDFSCPRLFLNAKFSPPKQEELQSKTPCAFLYESFTLKEEEKKDICSVSGYMRSLKELNSSLKAILSPGYLEKKEKENEEVINELTNEAYTGSSSKEFNLYVKQTYLDNLLRGGYPFTFPKSLKTFYLYSRKHGDPERDYNKFQISPTYLSQGNGNYRDLNQNRRNDIWFNPKVKEENLYSLINLIQLDGFNPLVVKGSLFLITNAGRIKEKLLPFCKGDLIDKILESFKNKHFSPGELIHFIEDNHIRLSIGYDQFLDIFLSFCSRHSEAEHGEGFWIDHWHYNLDLLESYLKVYPENHKKILFDDPVFTFFDNPYSVKPRNEKYLLYNGLPRQLHSVYLHQEKKELLHKRKTDAHLARKEYGRGDVYRTSLINKLLCILVNKFSSLDPLGTGIEMESDKPNWFDSLNGLPALFGSSSCETFELKRLALFLKTSLKDIKVKKIPVTEEICQLLKKLAKLTEESLSGAMDDFSWWDKTHDLKEEFRRQTCFGVSGKETLLTGEEIARALDLILRKIELGIRRARNKNIYHGYFINEVTSFKKLGGNIIKPLAFRQIPLPLFLEPQVHAMRLFREYKKAKGLYLGVKNSSLYDKKLKMYKVTSSLKDMPEEIGRCRVFPPGWLENESVWLHMEYKYLLEILNQGLYEEFFSEIKNVLVPFQNPQRYGRSTLENSSFIVSSAFKDKKMHGNGFVARLSGSTAELLDIWLKMNAGLKPFFLNRQERLNLEFKPILAGWLFNKNGDYCFSFLSSIKITYHNPARINTFGSKPAKIKRIEFKDKDGINVNITTSVIPHPYAEQIRSRQIKKIDIYLK